MCVGGPPNPVRPIRPHCTAIVASEGAGPGGDWSVTAPGPTLATPLSRRPAA